jgi:hypothetical protein
MNEILDFYSNRVRELHKLDNKCACATINAYLQIRKHNCTNSCTIVKCTLIIYLKSSMFKLIAVKGKKCKLFASCHMPI